jgi:hypothetical protein
VSHHAPPTRHSRGDRGSRSPHRTKRGSNVAQLTVRFFELLTKDEQQFPDIDALLDTVAGMPDNDAYVQLAWMELHHRPGQLPGVLGGTDHRPQA